MYFVQVEAYIKRLVVIIDAIRGGVNWTKYISYKHVELFYN